MLYESKDWLRGGNVFLEYNSDIIKNCLSAINVSNFFAILSSKSFKNDSNLTEKWMEGRYQIENFSDSDLQNCYNVTLDDSLQLPVSNKYLAEDMELKEDESRNWEFVKKIEESDFGELFFKADSRFNLPRVLLIRCDIIRKNAKNSSIFDFLPFALVRLMAEIGYDAETADIKYSFDADSHGFEIQISGLNDKLPVLFEEILNQITRFSTQKRHDYQ